jgi:toxin ParE2
MNYRFLAAAFAEVDNAAAWYEAQQSGLGAEFMQAVDAAIGQLLVAPESWPAIDADFRRCRVNRFPFDVVFNIQDDEALIFAVAHHHRKPDYWRQGE